MDSSKPNTYFEIYIIFLRFHTMQLPEFSYLIMAIARIQFMYLYMLF